MKRQSFRRQKERCRHTVVDHSFPEPFTLRCTLDKGHFGSHVDVWSRTMSDKREGSHRRVPR